ncbi:MAG: 50S ribosomal protein L20, partial [Verrucomicrobia bacterium]|nr:50S ribosomal protein L20 [Verrucomicrobiota bacterium]
KNKKRTFRALWQIRINAATRNAGLTYSRFIEGLKAAEVDVNRKVLAHLAATDEAAFGEFINLAKEALKTKSAATA